MFVLLYLLPLGLIFDLVGYMPPAARLFLVYALLGLPLCLKPSKQAGWLGLGLGLVMVLRAALPWSAVAETVLLLLAHFAIWTVVAPVPRALRVGVVAYAVVHMFLFVSPLGHPLLEMLTAAGNNAAHWIASEACALVAPAYVEKVVPPFNLGPSYLNIGGFLLLLMLSVFSWDGTRVGPLRSASFLLVALLLSAVAAVVLLNKVDFAGDFAWTLKFRDSMGLLDLWKRMQGLVVIVFPAFVFVAQLLSYLVLHYAKMPQADSPAVVPADAPRGWGALRAELATGKRQMAVAAMAVLAVLAMVPPTAWRRPAVCDLIFVERGVVSFTKPDYTRFGEYAGGMFGMLPEYTRMFGCKAVVVKDVPATLDPGKTLVLTNLDFDFGEATRKRIWEFVERGGKLWVIGDHTFIKEEKNPDGSYKKGINHLNEMLDSSKVHISFNNDSGEFFPQGWFNSYRFPQGTLFSGLHDDDENRPGILVGASLKLEVPAQPLVLGRFAYADQGLEIPKKDSGYIGDFKYQPNERLGDLVLVAGERHGLGRVLVFGDTSSFFNNNMGRSYELLRASLGWLGESNAWLFPASIEGRWLAAALVLGTLVLTFLWRAAPVGVAALCGVGLVAAITHGSGGQPPFDEGFCREHLALIDFSHQPKASKHSAMDTGLHGVAINLMRHDLLPIDVNVWDPATLDLARYVILNAPRQPLSVGEQRDLMGFMERGGMVIVGCGYLESAGSRGLLESLGCRIGNVPLGRSFVYRAFGQPVSFMSAWPLDKIPANAKVLCATPENQPLMVSVPVGKGQLLVIGDSEFLHNSNLEGQKNHDPANTTFLKNLFDTTAR